MTIFRTVVNFPKPNFEIDFNSNLMFVGSCFTENIGSKFEELGFNADINPFGIQYNPASILNGFDILQQNNFFSEKHLNYNNEKWFSYMHHSIFSDSDKNKCLEKINSRIEKTSAFLKTTNYIFITLGTARIYKLKSSNEVVSNCHKIPAKEFEKILLTHDEIVQSFTRFFQKLLEINKNVKIIFTVSPIRHWKDGAIENQISKSILFVAINELKNKFDNIYYFPAYEIMIDELRDYRFYDDDMLHPSKIAVDYIWSRFSENYFSNETQNLITEISKIIISKKHRPFNANSESYKNFLATNNQKINELIDKTGNRILEKYLQK